MSHLLTDHDGLQTLKRALNRFNNLLKLSDDEYCDISAQIKKIICGQSNLVQLLKLSQKYENVINALNSCDTKGEVKDDCNCNGKQIVRNSCDKEISATEFFCLMNSLKNGQYLVLGLHNDLAALCNLIVKNFSTECDVLPCEEKMMQLLKNLVCCPPPTIDDCNDFDRGYAIALIILISLIFSNKFHCIKCKICDETTTEEPHESCHEQTHESSTSSTEECHNKCNSCDACDPCVRCHRNIYEYSTDGLQVLLSLENQDNVSKWFAIIGMSLGGIVRQL